MCPTLYGPRRDGLPGSLCSPKNAQPHDRNYAGFDNCSVSGFILGKDERDPKTRELLGPPPTSMFVPPYRRDRGIMVQFLNRIDHLLWEPQMPNAEAHRDRMRGLIDYAFFSNPSTIAIVESDSKTAKSRL